MIWFQKDCNIIDSPPSYVNGELLIAATLIGQYYTSGKTTIELQIRHSNTISFCSTLYEHSQVMLRQEDPTQDDIMHKYHKKLEKFLKKYENIRYEELVGMLRSCPDSSLASSLLSAQQAPEERLSISEQQRNIKKKTGSMSEALGKKRKFGVSIHTNEPQVVMFLNGRKYKVKIEIKYDDDAIPVDAEVDMKPCNEPLTPSSSKKEYYKFGGFPRFIQNVFEPVTDDGVPYTYLCTIENNWGDCGNCNIFVLIKDDVVEDVFIEASCC